MGDRTPGTTDPRTTSYGDRVVDAGTRATDHPGAQHPAAPPSPPPPPPAPKPPQVARIILIDPKGIVPSGLRAAIATRVTNAFNGLRFEAQNAPTPKAIGVVFETSWTGKQPSAAEQDAYGRLDFPLYVFQAHNGATTSVSAIHALMKGHGIRDIKELYKKAEEGWKATSVEGLGIPPMLGYRKVGFIKADHLQKAPDLEVAYANVIRHELGHMLNITDHASTGLMNASVSLGNPSVGFDAAGLRTVAGNLMRLSRGTEAELQRRYESAK